MNDVTVFKPVVSESVGDFCPNCGGQILIINASEIDIFIDDHCSECDDIEEKNS